MTRLCAALIALLLAASAHAAPPAGVDPNGPVAHWVSRWENAKKEGCCGLTSDCRPTAIRPTHLHAESGYDAWIDKEKYGPTAPDDWVAIPRAAFSNKAEVQDGATSGDDNVTGVDWACWYDHKVRCASLGSGT